MISNECNPEASVIWGVAFDPSLEDDAEFAQFAQGEVKKVKVYGDDRYVDYDSRKRIGIAISKLGASKAVSVGAYAFALSELDTR